MEYAQAREEQLRALSLTGMMLKMSPQYRADTKGRSSPETPENRSLIRKISSPKKKRKKSSPINKGKKTPATNDLSSSSKDKDSDSSSSASGSEDARNDTQQKGHISVKGMMPPANSLASPMQVQPPPPPLPSRLRISSLRPPPPPVAKSDREQSDDSRSSNSSNSSSTEVAPKKVPVAKIGTRPARSPRSPELPKPIGRKVNLGNVPLPAIVLSKHSTASGPSLTAQQALPTPSPSPKKKTPVFTKLANEQKKSTVALQAPPTFLRPPPPPPSTVFPAPSPTFSKFSSELSPSESTGLNLKSISLSSSGSANSFFSLSTSTKGSASTSDKVKLPLPPLPESTRAALGVKGLATLPAPKSTSPAATSKVKTEEVKAVKGQPILPVAKGKPDLKLPSTVLPTISKNGQALQAIRTAKKQQLPVGIKVVAMVDGGSKSSFGLPVPPPPTPPPKVASRLDGLQGQTKKPQQQGQQLPETSVKSTLSSTGSNEGSLEVTKKSINSVVEKSAHLPLPTMPQKVNSLVESSSKEQEKNDSQL